MFTGNEDHEIPAEKAKGYIRRWREGRGKGEVQGGFFGRAVLDRMLAQPGCVGLRIYHAKHEKGNATFVLVGTNADGQDLWQGTVAEEMLPCPPNCPTEPL